MTPGAKTYLGDGVYAEATEYGEVKLWTEREGGTHWMVLGPDEILALLRFLAVKPPKGVPSCSACEGRGIVSPYGTPTTQDRYSIQCHQCGKAS